MKEEEYDTNMFLYGKLRNTEALSVYGLASNFREKWKRNKAKFYVNLGKCQKVTDSIQHFTKQYRFFSSSLALTIGAYLVINDELTMGSMIAASLLMARTTQPVDGATITLSRIGVVKEAFWRLEKMLCTPLEIKLNSENLSEENEVINKQERLSTIAVENVDISYNNDEGFVLKGFNNEFGEGEVTAVVGQSGCGKTTLIKAMAGLVKYEGVIRYDKTDLKDFSFWQTPKFY